jgi:predicted porin
MKKLLIATAALAMVAGTAQAQSSVTVYGLLDTSYQAIDSTAANGASTDTTNAGVSGALSGSRLGFRGTEDLGGGLKANFTYEMNLGSADGTIGTNARLSFVELAGNFGAVRAGRQVTPQKAVMDTFYASGNSGFAAGLVGTNADVKTDGERVSSAVTYLTPAMSGFQAQLQIAGATSDTSAADKTSTEQMNYGVSYRAGKFAAGVGINNVDAKTEGGTQSEITYTAFGASYDFGVATLFATNSEKKTETRGTAIHAKGEETTVGVRVPVGKWTLVAQYADGESNAAGNATKTDYEGYQLHAIYNLSKRTNVYALYGDDESKVAGATSKASRDGFAVGVRHSF